MSPKPTTTAEYLATLTSDKRVVVAELRKTIRSAMPRAQESFSYGMPAFSLDGRVVVWYAAWKRHYSLYPIGDALLGTHSGELDGIDTSKGTIRFPAERPLPYQLIKALVKARVAELKEKGT